MSYTFSDLSYDVLKRAPEPLDCREIWDQATILNLSTKVNSQGKTPWRTIGAHLGTNIRTKSDSKFIIVDARPQKFFLKEREDELENILIHPVDKNEKPIDPGYKEIQLHQLLSYFVYNSSEFFSDGRIHTKTIRHSKSKGGSNKLKEWLHPDMVGVYYPFGDLEGNVIEVNKLLNQDSPVKVFSFELKRSLTKGTYRQCFFQAVSNSSWAHEGYLVAAEISESAALHGELSRLSNAFGIGVIHLNLKDISSSQVLYNARSKSQLDWETINKLYEMNQDFASFIGNLRSDITAARVNTAEYEAILDDAVRYIRRELKIKSVE